MNQSEPRAKACIDELVERLNQSCDFDGAKQIVEGLHFYRYSSPTQPVHGVYSPAICVVAQGAKEVMLGDEVFRYDPSHFILGSLDVPIVAQVVEASPEKPYLGLKLELDPALIASVSVETGVAPGRPETS